MTSPVETVHILVIVNRYGTVISACRTEPSAKAALLNYVRENWAESVPDADIPKDPADAISDYFERVEGHPEYAILEAVPVEP